MNKLGEGEEHIHDDIGNGRRATHIILSLLGFTFFYMLGLVFFQQRARRRTLERSRDELELLVETRTADLGEANKSLQQKIAEREETHRRMATEWAVSKALAESSTLADARSNIFHVIGKGLQWDLGELWGAYWSTDKQTAILRCVQSWQPSEHAFPEFEEITKQTTFLPGIGLPGRAFAGGEPMWVDDVTGDTNFVRAAAAEREGLRTGFAFPVRKGNEILGVMVFFSREIRPPDELLLLLFKSLGAQIGEFMARLEAQEVLLRIEDRYRVLAETASDAIISIDEQSRIFFANLATEKIFGYRRAELIGAKLTMLLPQDLRERHLTSLQRYLSTGQRHMTWNAVDTRGLHKDGREIPIEISFNELVHNGSRVFTGIIRDITDRKRAEEMQQLQMKRIRALHEIDLAITSTLDLPFALSILLEKVNLFFPCPAVIAVRLLNKETGVLEPVAVRNIPKEEWIAHMRGIPDPRRGFGRMAVEARAPMIALNIQTDPRTQDKVFYRMHGLVSSIFVPLIAKDEPVGTLCIYAKEEHDFTEEEIEFLTTLGGQAAIAIHNAQLYEQTMKQAAALEKSNKVKDEFLSVMSHELRTPLNVVMGYTGMLMDGMLGEVNDKQKEAMGKVINRANDQLAMINNILYATVLDTEKTRVESHELSLGAFLAQLKSGYEAPINKKLVFNWDYPTNLPLIRTDSAKLKQILQNLIENALKFTGKGSVTVSARITEGSKQKAESSKQTAGELPTASRLLPTSGKWVEFKVADSGVGIPQEHLPFIFDKFRQVDSSETRSFGGVGMGLYVVKKFTDLLGGTVEVESEPGEGSTFTVRIPWES